MSYTTVEGRGESTHLEPAFNAFIAATVDLLLAGLNEWLEAGVKDRDSAQENRASAELDRRDQKKARWVMVLLSAALLVTGAINLLRGHPTPIVNIPAPAAMPAPVVNVPPVPVTLSPVINIIPAPHRSAK